MPNPQKDFIKAAKSGNLTAMKMLLENDRTLLEAKDSDGSTALHCATWKGHREIVGFLIGAGIDINAHNQNEHWGTTPLHAAAHANQTAIAELLIKAGADVNAKDLSGKTPLHHTTFHKANATAKLLVKNGAV